MFERIALLLVMVVVATACSGGSAAEPTSTTVTETTAPSTTSSTTTTTTTAAPEPPCTTGIPDAFGENTSGFEIVAQQDIFGCFKASSFRSEASYDGTVLEPNDPRSGHIAARSEQVMDADTLLAHTVMEYGDEVYETYQVGDSLFAADGQTLSDQIPIEVFESQVALAQVVATAVIQFGPIVRDLGPELHNGIETRHYVAEPEDIATWFEERIAREYGETPEIELLGNRLELWADAAGNIVELDFRFDFFTATGNGAPAADVLVAGVPLADLLPQRSGEVHYRLFDFNAPIEIDVPGLGS